MKQYKLLGIISFIFCFGLPCLAKAGTVDASMQANSVLNATCSISASSINFGNLATPLNSQSASSNMEVFCNKGTSYTIDIFYGGVYGTGNNVNGILTNTNARYLGYSPGVGSLYSCTYSGYIDNVFYTTNNSNYNGCAANMNYSASITYDYGVMQGVAKGDVIAYAIYVPNDPSKIWNNNVNSYTATATGNPETLTMSAKIVPAKSGAQFPTPDLYSDTVTAKITY